jgi:hypothetical protein
MRVFGNFARNLLAADLAQATRRGYTADLGGFGAWIEDSHGEAVQLAPDYDSRYSQLPPA